MSIAEKLTTVAENVPKVYEAGAKSEYDKFWDAFQNNGKKTFYQYAFYAWNDGFYPKYDIKPEGSLASAFFLNKIKGDMKQRLIDCGVEFNTSLVYNMNSSFQACYDLTVAPILDLSSMGDNSLGNTFFNCVNLTEASFVNMQAKTRFSNTFFACEKLEKLSIDGVIGQAGFNVKDCTKLTKASLLSILKALSLNITETKTITFSTAHQSIIETDSDCKPYWEAAKDAGWSFVYA